MILISNLIKMQNKTQKQERYFKTRSCRFIKRDNIYIFDNDYFILCSISPYEVLNGISVYIDSGMFKADEVSLALFSHTRKPELITKFANYEGYYHHDGGNVLFGPEIFREKNLIELIQESPESWKEFQNNKFAHAVEFYLGICLSNRDNRMNNLGKRVSFVVVGA